MAAPTKPAWRCANGHVSAKPIDACPTCGSKQITEVTARRVRD